MGNLIYFKHWGAVRWCGNVNDLSVRLHSAKEENATNQVTLTRIMEIINDQFQSLRAQNESGKSKGNCPEKQMAELSKFISEKTSGKLETKGKTMGMSEMRIGKAPIQEIRGRWGNQKSEI